MTPFYDTITGTRSVGAAGRVCAMRISVGDVLGCLAQGQTVD